MKVSEAVEHMTKAYLHRIIDSFTKDLPKPEEERSREIIIRNAEELTDTNRIHTILHRERLYSDQILHGYILEALVNRPEYLATEEEIIAEVTDLEREALEEAEDPAALRYEDSRSVEIFSAVLSVALEDDIVSEDELRLVQRLREKLGIHERTKRILLTRLNHFPRAGNEVHSPADCRDALTELQRRGVVFYCNRLNGGRYVLPEEIVVPVKRALGIEINRTGWAKLLDHLTKEQLGTILEAAGLPRTGRKEELQHRVRSSGLRATECLGHFSNQELYLILSELPGATVGGNKDERIARIVDYFDKMVFRDVPEEAPAGEVYYRYLKELAAREREILLANKVIKKDREMDPAFEVGTRYLFSEKLGLPVLTFPGSDHPDGGVEIGRRGELLLWDNKSKESVYVFPASHRQQFKRYIRDSDRRVSCFLVIVPDVDDCAAEVAARLKVESGTDSDIAVIRAEDLVWVAEQHGAKPNGRPFNPEVFNITGILDRALLERRMKLFR